ncbi:DUF2189 domain-containing protein [Methylovirgula sp. 4M-Z18]|uniref:DUF2189 domain-containing protein n=1 Tax=Methylovirgula sp. 4M-Z18 TaxID=2293567 RepID=UPI000E2ED4A8|nr:DUF2189 domain-containing protein [Methylovirgula sp. 4M-Z18]RFB78246.1 DUF2189 domain-containing protein [Methylovirgula sp. 4M-Z18]
MAKFHVFTGTESLSETPSVNKISAQDLKDAFDQGVDDFRTMPSHLAFLILIYPFCGIVLAILTSQENALQLLFPLASGFALIGPLAAIGLYEMSRRRELGLETSWKHAINIIHSPSLPAIIALGIGLFAIFLLWLGVAQSLYEHYYGPFAPESYPVFLSEIFSTYNGMMLLFWGCFIGFCFALVTLCISVISFPMLLDRDVGAATAVMTSLRATRANPVMVAFWGLLVAVLLFLGSIPFFIGLAVALPVLGHATWHLYRKLVPRNQAEEHPVRP